VKRRKYQDKSGHRQIDKEATAELAEEIEDRALELLCETEFLHGVERYVPTDRSLYRRGSPIVPLPDRAPEEGALAPDLMGSASDGTRIWVEVKEKTQRAFYPDTGCDMHQFIGFWTINHVMAEPVLMMFIDPPIKEIQLPKTLKGSKRTDYLDRLRRFSVDGEPAFYGGWLSDLASYDPSTKYPRCYLQWSRKIPMRIVYFEIRKMRSFKDVPALSSVIGEFRAAQRAPPFRVFDMDEKALVEDPGHYKHSAE